MISERAFAQSFASFWVELLPLLTPSLVHVINEVYKERLIDNFGLFLDPVEGSPGGGNAVIAEFAFYLAKSATEAGIPIKSAFDNDRIRNDAATTAALMINYYEVAIPYPRTDLEKEELLEGFEIAQNYVRFFEQVSTKGTIHFLPALPGAGFLKNCQADLAIGRALFEVKTVNRNFASKDIKQLITYLALQAATGDRKWSLAGFFNPRRAEYLQFPIDEVLTQVSGGRSSSEVYHSLIDFVSSSDVEIDTAF